MLRILADENIPFVEHAFRDVGQVTTIPGHAITRSAVRSCDVLLVRSVTRVDGALLDGSPVHFVGSATIGTDHVDTAALQHLGIDFAHAPGSNALSVVEYVLTALLHHAARTGAELDSMTVGVVGCGNTGGRLATRLAALGCRVLRNDPPLEREAESRGVSHEYVALDRVLDDAEVISLHVPLTREGIDATTHLLNTERLGRLDSNVCLINTSRGAVVDNRALLGALQSGTLGSAVLDVWEGEPSPMPELIERVDLATPHIAGYSFDGKVEGTRMLVRAVADYLGIQPAWDGTAECAETEEDRLDLDPQPFRGSPAAWLYELAGQAYPIDRDDRGMRVLASVDADRRAALFNRMRKEYPRRRTFGLFRLRAHGLSDSLRWMAREGLGFRLV